jgi:hypothetical protein
MEQNMTTSTSAEQIFEQRQVWTRTEVAATPWIFASIFASSSVAYVAVPDTNTVPDLPPLVLGIDWLNVQEFGPERYPVKEQLSLFSADPDPLRKAVLHLLAYTPVPDEPGDHDVEPGLQYRLPG